MKKTILALAALTAILAPSLAISARYGLVYGCLIALYGIVILGGIAQQETKTQQGVLLFFFVLPLLYSLLLVWSWWVLGSLLMVGGVALLGNALPRYRQLIQHTQTVHQWPLIETTYPDDIEQYEFRYAGTCQFTPEGETEEVPKGLMRISLPLEYVVEDTWQAGTLIFHDVTDVGRKDIPPDILDRWQQYPLRFRYNPADYGELVFYKAPDLVEKELETFRRKRRTLCYWTAGLLLSGMLLIILGLL
jgi:hypothetical protein